MIEDYNDRKTFEPDQEVVIPKRQWNPSGVFANGYQLVPVLCYHNLAPEAKGRLVLAVSSFEQQMQYLASEGYRVVSLDALVAYTALGGQLPRKSVVLTFDDGYRSFLQYAYPILAKHGFTATLFVYTDYVGTRNAMSWDDLRRLADEGFTIGAHSKSHNDLRRHQGETAEAFAQRMQAELAQPLQLFRARLGREPKFLAYPYGAHDDDVVRKVQDYGYAAAFSVRREGNASFAYPLRMRRSQIYAEMSLKDFAPQPERLPPGAGARGEETSDAGRGPESSWSRWRCRPAPPPMLPTLRPCPRARRRSSASWKRIASRHEPWSRRAICAGPSTSGRSR